MIEFPVPATEIGSVIFTDCSKESTYVDCSSNARFSYWSTTRVRHESCKTASEDYPGRGVLKAEVETRFRRTEGSYTNIYDKGLYVVANGFHETSPVSMSYSSCRLRGLILRCYPPVPVRGSGLSLLAKSALASPVEEMS